MDFIRGNENVNDKNISQLLTLQAVSKHLGIPKSGVQALIDGEQLSLVDVGGKSYITTASLFCLLGQKGIVDFGQQNTGYPATEELSCTLTKSNVVQLPIQEGVKDMIYTGSISTLKDGRYMVQIEKGKKPDGKRDRESKGFKDEAQAQQYLKDRLAELNGTNQVQSPPSHMVQPYTAPPGIDMYAYTDKTFEQYTIATLNAGIGKATTRTIEGYRISLIRVTEYIGRKKMVDITADELRKMFQELSFQYLKSTLKKAFNTTKMIFDIAIQNNDIPSTPFATLKCPRSRKVSDTEQTPYTDEEIKEIFALSKDYHNPMLYPIFTVMDSTGMRPGELRALEWSRFNADSKTIRIVQAVSKEYEEIESISKKTKETEFVTVTKNIYGVRTLKLSDVAVQALLDWKKVLDTFPIPMKTSKFIFPSQKGGFKSETSLKTVIQRFVKKVGIKDMGLTLYRFRHTMCTRLILDGQPIPVIQRIMGDNTTDVIMKVYTHVTEQQAMAACGDYYDRLNQRHLESVV